MRRSLAQSAFLAMMTLLLAGCTNGSSMKAPGWAFWKWNPFSSSPSASEAPAYPDMPSEFATPSSNSSAAGFASAGGQAMAYPGAPGKYNSISSNPNAQSAYPSAGSSLPNRQVTAANSTPSGNFATTPQQGAYDSGAYSRIAGQQYGYHDPGASYRGSSASQAVSGTSPITAEAPLDSGVSRYSSPSGPQYPSAAGQYKMAETAPPYGSATDTSRYQTKPNGYSGFSSRGDTSNSYPTSREPSSRYTADVKAAASQYENDFDSADPLSGRARYPDSSSSRYDSSSLSRSGTGGIDTTKPDSRYDSGVPSGRLADRYSPSAIDRAKVGSESGDRYARAPIDTLGSLYGDTQPKRSEDTNDWSPGGPTPNMPGRGNYDPGNMGYNPPNAGRYSSPATSYQTSDNRVPYSPGSIKPFTPSTAGSFDAASSGSSQADTGVVPAAHSWR